MLRRINRHLQDLNQTRLDRKICRQLRSAGREWNAEHVRVIFSESRGGSTWLFEMLLQSGEMVSQWEPLHPVRGTVSELPLHYGDRPYLTPDEKDDALLNCLIASFSGKAWTPWTARYNSPESVDSADKLLVKFVRANMLAPWILHQIQLRYKPVMLIRHPVAVALSQLDAFRGADRDAVTYKVPNCHNNQRFVQNEQYLNGLEGALERKVALWCINNLPVLQNEQFMLQVQPVFYEYLVLNPQEQFAQIALNWDLTFSGVQANNASSTTGRAGVDQEPLAQISKWMGRINDQQKENCKNILQYFGCTLYSVDDPLPLNIK